MGTKSFQLSNTLAKKSGDNVSEIKTISNAAKREKTKGGQNDSRKDISTVGT